MKPKVANMIPGRKAKDAVTEKKIPPAPEDIGQAAAAAAEAPEPENREMPDDKKQNAEARREFDAKIRGKLKYSRKR